MAAVWIILGKTRYRQSSLNLRSEHGVRTASVPFDISAEFIPDLLRAADTKLRRAQPGQRTGGRPSSATSSTEVPRCSA